MNEIAINFNDKIGKPFTEVRGSPILMLANGMMKVVGFDAAFINAIPCEPILEHVSNIQCAQTLSDIVAHDTMNVICEKMCKNSEFPL